MNDNNMRPPPDKKRRTDVQRHQATADQMWDDECEDFTEDQWDNIDVLVASQQGNSSGTGQYGTLKPKPSEGPSSNAQPTPVSLNAGKLIGRGTLKSKSSNDVSTKAGIASTSDQTLGMENYQPRLSDRMQQENTQLKEECRHLSKQIEKYKNAHYSTDGRLKILQENVAQKDAELMRLKQEKVAIRDQQSKETTNKEKELDREVNKLRTQLQFKEQEILEIQQQCKQKDNLLTKLSDYQGDCKGAQVKLGKAAPNVSPNSKTSASVNLTNTFPTTQSFLIADQTSSRCAQKKVFTEKSTQSQNSSERTPRQRLRLSNPKGQRTGQQLVLKLLHAHVGTSDTSPKPMASSTCISSECDNAGSSPDTRTLSPGSSMLTASDSSVDEEWFQRQYSNFSGHMAEQVILLLRTVQSLLQVSFVCHPGTGLLNTHDHNAILLLPVIKDILSECLVSADAVRAEDVSSSIPMSSPSLGSSTTETTTVSDASPGHGERTGYSNGGALSTKLANLLRLLLCLVESSAQVREAMLAELITTNKVNHTAIETLNTQNHVTGEDTAAGRSLAQCTDFVLHGSLLHKLCCLVSQVAQQIGFATTPICVYAMNILAVILESARPDHIRQLNVFCVRDAMMSCVTSTDCSNVDKVAIGLAVLRVLQSLMREQTAVACLCSHTFSTDYQPPTNECLLDAVYTLCFQASLDLPISQRTILQTRLCSTISTAVSCRRLGLNLLVNQEKDCPCNEVVKLLVCRLYDTWQSLLHCSRPCDTDLLRMATSLLQVMSVMDKDYIEHRDDVEPQYVDSVCGLQHLFDNQLSLLHPVEKSVCNNLCDFKQDLPLDEDEQEESQETSQDSPSHQQKAHSVSKAPAELHLDSHDQPAGPSVCSGGGRPPVSSHELKRSLSTTREPGKLSRRKLSTTTQRQHTSREQPMDVVDIDKLY